MGACNTVDIIEMKIQKEKDKRAKKISHTTISTCSQKSKERPNFIIPQKIVNTEDICTKYQIKTEYIGKGASGIISEGTDASRKKYAIKTINKSKIKNINHLIEEIQISLSLSHENILKYYEVYEDSFTVSVVMDLIESGDLFDFITNYKNGHLEDEMSIDLIVQILEVIDYLHNVKHICHRDIKPENFLISIENSKPKIKLIDFGFATHIIKNTKMNSNLGTPLYKAPEITNRDPYDEKVDLWSAGIVIFNIVTGCHPFSNNKNVPIEEQIISSPIPFEVVENEKIRNLLEKLLERDPNKRYSARKALQYAIEIQRDIKEKRDNDELESKEIYDIFRILNTNLKISL